MASPVFGISILWIIGLFFLYLVIYKALKKGINKSVVERIIERTPEPVIKKSFLDDDFDN